MYEKLRFVVHIYRVLIGGPNPNPMACPVRSRRQGWLPAEFMSLLSDEAMHGLIEIDFFDRFPDGAQRRFFDLASLVAQTDCLNSPARAVAERRVVRYRRHHS